MTAFKRDLLTLDQICIAFASNGRELVVTEDSDGWPELVEKLPEYLPGCMPHQEWFLAVAQPPFAPSPLVIYRRP